MKIETLTLKNFRCFGPDGTSISFEESLTAFVGGNGCGKTAAFQALVRLFGITSAQCQFVGMGRRQNARTEDQ